MRSTPLMASTAAAPSLTPLRAARTTPRSPRAEGDDPKDEDDKDKDKGSTAAEEDEWEDDPDNPGKQRKKNDHSQTRDKAQTARLAPGTARGASFVTLVSDDDDGDRADQADPDMRGARARQRSWFKAVLESDAGKAAFKANPDRAIRFALTFTGTRSDAIATLELFGDKATATADQPRQETRQVPLRDRMAQERVETPAPGNGGGGEREMSVADQIIHAGKVRRGEVDA